MSDLVNYVGKDLTKMKPQKLISWNLELNYHVQLGRCVTKAKAWLTETPKINHQTKILQLVELQNNAYAILVAFINITKIKFCLCTRFMHMAKRRCWSTQSWTLHYIGVVSFTPGRFITTTPTAAGSNIVGVTYWEGILQKGAEEETWA